MPLLSRLSRRRLLKRTAQASAVLAVPTALYTFAYEPYALETTHHRIPAASLGAPSWAGKTVLQLSDLHIGRTPDFHLRRALAKANALTPDLLVITGDFMSCHGPEQIPAVTALLRDLAPVPQGIHACLGNHDYGHSWSDTSVADELVDSLAKLHIHTLRNQTLTLAGLQLTGLEDLWSPNWSTTAAQATLTAAAGGLCLAHNPDTCDLPLWSNYQGLILAGHTHGGQCKPPFLPPPLLPVKNRRYTAGFFSLAPNLSLYINRATGNLRNYRFNCPPEITVFHLT